MAEDWIDFFPFLKTKFAYAAFILLPKLLIQLEI